MRQVQNIKIDLDPFLVDFYKKFESCLINNLCLGKNDSIVCAVSGGVDSVVLLDNFVHLIEKYHFKVSVVHFNHKLRGNSSDRDELFVKKLSESYKLPYYISSANVRQYALNNLQSIELAARNLRYDFFEKVSKESKSNYLATAHTSDDVVETFFLNLFRGSGITGLSGIPEKRPLTKFTLIIRPLLGFTKSDIIEYARKKNLKWKVDETNVLQNFTRNKIRLDLLPKLRNDYNKSINDAILRLSKLLEGADKFISEHIRNYLKYIVSNKTNSGFSINVKPLSTLDEFIIGEIIQWAITTYFQIPPLSMIIIDRIKNLLTSPSGRRIEINKRIIAYRDREMIIFEQVIIKDNLIIEIGRSGEFEFNGHKLLLKEIPKKSVKFSGNPNTEIFDLDLLPVRLIIRNWKEGDNFIPLGMNGKMKVSDFLINRKIPIPDKRKVFLLTTKKDIIWLFGLRINDKFKVTENTKRYLMAEYIKK